MTLHQLYQMAIGQFESNAQESCAFDLSCLMQQLFGIQREMLPVWGGREADPASAKQFLALVKRYANGEPLQYLLGEWDFYGMTFAVGPGVLIPRPDTETLVEVGLAFLRDIAAPVVGDFCSGSGCVAIALAHRHVGAKVFALEKSTDAYTYLVKNIDRHSATVEPLCGDVFSPPPLPILDLILCNPPYLSTDEMQHLQTQVSFEPQEALCGGHDGLNFYRLLPHICYPLLRPGGCLAFEVGYTQAESVIALLREAGYSYVLPTNDLCGVKRVVSAIKPKKAGAL